jgi:hypothetical protein
VPYSLNLIGTTLKFSILHIYKPIFFPASNQAGSKSPAFYRKSLSYYEPINPILVSYHLKYFFSIKLDIINIFKIFKFKRL